MVFEEGWDRCIPSDLLHGRYIELS